MALQASAGLLYEIVLVDTNFADGAQRFEFVDALGSAQCRVRTLHMGGMTPDLGCEGGATVGKMLAANTSVTNIELQYSGLGDVGGTALAKGLKVNTALTSINLDNNALGEAGGTALAAALKVNTTLTYIHLGDNALGAVACTALAAALKSNTTLTDIVEFDGNAIPDATTQAIRAAVAKNKEAAK